MYRRARIVRRGLATAVLLLSGVSALSMGGGPHWANLSELVQAARETEDIEPIVDRLSESLARSAADDDALASAVGSFVLAEIFEERRRYQDALHYYEAGLRALKQGDTDVAANVDFLLARISGMEKSFMGEPDSPGSLDLYSGVVFSGELATMPPLQASNALATALYMNAGNLYLLQNQREPANAYFEQAIAAAEEAGDRRVEAQARSNMAWAAILSGDFTAADELLNAATQSLANQDERLFLRKAALAIGVNARENGDIPRAEAELRDAILLYRQANDETGLGRALAHFGTALYLADKPDHALAAYQEALRTAEKTEDTETFRHSYGGLARTYKALGQATLSADAFRRYFEALDMFVSSWRTDQGRVGIFENQQAMLAAYASVESEIAEESGDFARLRDVVQQVRGRALACLLQSKLNRPPRQSGTLPGGPVLYGKEWDYVQYEYAHAISSGGFRMMAQMTEDVQLDLATGGSEFDDYCGIQSSYSDVDTADLPVLEYYVGSDELVILLTDNRGVQGAVVDVSAGELRGLVNRFARTLGVERPRGIGIAGPVADGIETSDDPESVARELYELLVLPVEAYLPEEPDARLTVVPNDALWRLPYAVLLNADNQYFGDRYRMSYITSRPALKMLGTRPRNSDHTDVSAWVVGNPSLPEKMDACGTDFVFDKLPGAEDEAIAIATILGQEKTQLFLDGEADRLRLDAWHGDYSVLHLATHGVACPDDPLSSFIALSTLDESDIEIADDSTIVRRSLDSRLPVYLELDFDPQDIAQAPSLGYAGMLQARHVIQDYSLDADLVTLSTCQSGLGHLSGEGMIGFARAFLAAGSRSLLVSLWKVDDAATQVLMTSFYREYARHGDKGRAIQTAMKDVREQYPDPRHWAGFVLLGLQE